jgi:predicted PurR-regulated permease PerM
MKTVTGNSSIIGVLIGGACIFIIVLGMRLSASILSPILLAVIIAISVDPLINWLERKGLSSGLAFLVTLILMFLVSVGVIVLLGYSVSGIIASLPEYVDNLQGQNINLQTFLSGSGIDASSLQGIDFSPLLKYVGTLFGGLFGFFSSLVLMLMVFFFLLLATPGLTSKMNTDFAANSPTIARFRGLANDLREYVGITTWINFLVGAVNAVFLLILGVDFAILWGFLSFLLGYIPSVGFLLALIPPTALAFLEFGTTKALIVLVGFVVINGGVQNFIQPKLMGAGLNLSALVVVLSLFFWGWVLGPMGALLAVPLTMIVKDVFLDAYDNTRGLADLMSADSPSKPAPEESAS